MNMAHVELGRARPIVIGHRGASGYRPEHTLAAYLLAILQGADFIEPDLVATLDGALVARHENEIGTTTDVAEHPEFARRRTTKLIDGASVTGWFTEDFTLAELKTLRARERLPEVRPDNTRYDGEFGIPTLEDVIVLAKLASLLSGRVIGIYPETKHPSYFDSIGLSLEEPLVRTLHRFGYRGPRAPVFIQSFEVANLKELSGMTQLPLVQLLNANGQPYDFTLAGDPRTYAEMATPDGLADIASYAHGIGPSKNLVAPPISGSLGQPTSLIAAAHAEGLIVHAWTFRRENSFLPADFRAGDPSDPAYLRTAGDLSGEVARFLSLGLDGLFSDNPDLAVQGREQFLAF